MRLHPFLTVLLVASLPACEEERAPFYQGYVEADYIYVSSLESGRIVEIYVNRGDQVAQGQLIAKLDDTDARAFLARAQAELHQAQSDLADLQKGERPEELAIMRSQIEQAKARIKLSEPRVERRRQLVKQNIVGQESVDEAEAAIEEDQQRIAEMEARLRAAEMPARSDQIEAAKAHIRARMAALRQAEWLLEQYQLFAPEGGRIEDVYYRNGEHLEAGRPLVQLLPPTRLKIRFYVPEPALGNIAIGQKVHIACDSCAVNQTAVIRFIANQAEYTPPVIYSRESRAKLVYLVEAYPEDKDQTWHPGQPMDVYLDAGR